MHPRKESVLWDGRQQAARTPGPLQGCNLSPFPMHEGEWGDRDLQLLWQGQVPFFSLPKEPMAMEAAGHSPKGGVVRLPGITRALKDNRRL